MEELPLYISLLFGLIVIATVIWFYFAGRSKTFLLLAIFWVVLQSVVGASGFYQDTETIPPRIMLFGVFPTLILITWCFLTPKGRGYIDRFDLKTLTYFHSIRIAVEFVLILLFYQEVISVYMTPGGTNFDLFSGLTAPVVAWLAFRKKPLNKTLLWWNLICLLLLLNVVITAVFAFPSPFQKIAFDQPNIAILYFPFNLLPTVVVPLVFFAHLIAFRQLVGNEKLSSKLPVRKEK
jgi:heme A synthase